MNPKALAVLEYEKIIGLLQKEAGSEMTRQLAGKVRPLTEIHRISEELRSTTEAVDLIVRKGQLPTGGLYDIVPSLKLARKGGSLTPAQLLQIHYCLSIASSVVAFMNGEDMPETPLIREMTDLIETVPRLEREIDRCILTEDEIADDASPALRSIRREIGRQNLAIRNKLNQMVSGGSKTFLQDAIVTMRDGRYVIPVKQEYRTQVPGLIHDQSKGGATLFIEPQAVVELNNRLRQLELDEQAEIARILQELSQSAAEHYHGLVNNQKLLLRLDLIMAKGKLSLSMDGASPQMDPDGRVHLVRGRHPLLDPQKAVPLTMDLGADFSTLIITGPNTGGKTVCLKTVGLLALMAQSGLHIPASAQSRMPIFSDVFADIGDEQSIEQSLSTFSSHMKNIVEIMDQAKAGVLVLLDELGAGTDPTEGAALAISILDQLKTQGASVMATTHYNELKKYALSTPGVENGSMEFHVETLSPTYRMTIGIPGRSNAFEISRKLGLSEAIVARAGNLIEGKDMAFEEVISAIDDDKKRARSEREEAEVLRAALAKKEAQLAEKTASAQARREKILADAREEAREILREARETAKEAGRQLRDLEKTGDLAGSRRALESARQKIRTAEKKNAPVMVQKVNTRPVQAASLRKGDRVKVLTLDQNGEILSLPDAKGDLQVQVGMLKVNANVKDLMVINDGTQKKKNPERRTQYGALYKAKASAVSAEINVQGKNLEDAAAEVSKYLDDVYLAGLDKVTIIHGRGEGILQKGIRDMLKHSKQVASFHAGAYNEGGEGITVVTMKKE